MQMDLDCSDCQQNRCSNSTSAMNLLILATAVLEMSLAILRPDRVLFSIFAVVTIIQPTLRPYLCTVLVLIAKPVATGAEAGR
jgi:Mg2+/Co2+ transporter CorB